MGFAPFSDECGGIPNSVVSEHAWSQCYVWWQMDGAQGNYIYSSTLGSCNTNYIIFRNVEIFLPNLNFIIIFAKERKRNIF
jgi:hypothetical protein